MHEICHLFSVLVDTEIHAILSLLNHTPKESKHGDVMGSHVLHFLVPFNVMEHRVNNPHK